MTTSWNETQLIEAYLHRQLRPEDALLFEARLLVEPDLQQKTTAQKRTYALIRQYTRKQLKQEIEAVHRQLFSEPKYRSFREKVLQLFR